MSTSTDTPTYPELVAEIGALQRSAVLFLDRFDATLGQIDPDEDPDAAEAIESIGELRDMVDLQLSFLTIAVDYLDILAARTDDPDLLVGACTVVAACLRGMGLRK